MEPQKITYDNLNNVPEKSWKNLSKKNIFFGHQSVGNNIVEGIGDIQKQKPEIPLKVIELKNFDGSKNGFFIHEPNLGKNDYPDTKIAAFNKILSDQIGKYVDISLMKFCFVDIVKDTNVNEVFEKYTSTIESLKKRFPKMVFIHSTVPLLRADQSKGFKAWLKNILGKNDGFFANAHNIKRNELNDLIRNKYTGKDAIFDIADIESTFPDGKRCYFENNGKQYYALVPEYTDDGGHLNIIGRKKVAEQLLLLLINISN